MSKTDYKWSIMDSMTPHIDIHILDYPDALPSARYGIQDLFTIANFEAEQHLFTCQEPSTKPPTTPPTTPSVKPTLSPSGTGTESIIFVPPSLSRQLPSFSDTETLSILKEGHLSGSTIVAAYAGVFWLANAGLLEEKQVTTHWLLCDELEKNYPGIESVNKSDMVVDQGDIVTAAGLYAFQDLTLHLIARFAGFSLAKKVADYALLDLKGRLQSYYQRFYPKLNHGDHVITQAQQFFSKHVCSNVSILLVAEHCHLSQRTLLRRFTQATGHSPKHYFIQLKVEKAKQLIELDNHSIAEVGYKLGYTDTSNFFKQFKQVAGITPAEFRSRQTLSVTG